MLVLKKKEIIAAALVVLIGVAGYLNWSYQDTVRVTDGADYTEAAKKLGEAQYVSTDANAVETEDKKEEASKTNAKADTKKSSKSEKEEKSAPAVSTEEYFAKAKTEKETSRSKALEILNKTAENESFDEDTRKNAQQKILDMASNTEKESIIESIARAKGYNDISVYIEGESADIIVQKDNFSEKDVVVLKEIAAEQLEIGPSNIKIVERSQN